MASVRIPIQDIDVRPKWFQMQAVEVRCPPPMLKLMPALQNEDNRSGGAKGEDSMVPSMYPPQPMFNVTHCHTPPHHADRCCFLRTPCNKYAADRAE